MSSTRLCRLPYASPATLLPSRIQRLTSAGLRLPALRQLIATLLLDLDPSDSSSLPTIRSSLQLLAAETQEPEPYFYPSSDEDDDDDDQADADDVQRMLASWSLDGSSAASGVDGGLSEHGGSSTGTSVSASSSRDDSIEFLKMLFPYSCVPLGSLAGERRRQG